MLLPPSEILVNYLGKKATKNGHLLSLQEIETILFLLSHTHTHTHTQIFPSHLMSRKCQTTFNILSYTIWVILQSSLL